MKLFMISGITLLFSVTLMAKDGPCKAGTVADKEEKEVKGPEFKNRWPYLEFTGCETVSDAEQPEMNGPVYRNEWNMNRRSTVDDDLILKTPAEEPGPDFKNKRNSGKI